MRKNDSPGCERLRILQFGNQEDVGWRFARCPKAVRKSVRSNRFSATLLFCFAKIAATLFAIRIVTGVEFIGEVQDGHLA